MVTTCSITVHSLLSAASAPRSKHTFVIYWRRNAYSAFILVINQLDAQICFTISSFPASTCFEHHVFIVRRSKLYYTASGIITPIGWLITKINTMRCTVSKTSKFLTDFSDLLRYQGTDMENTTSHPKLFRECFMLSLKFSICVYKRALKRHSCRHMLKYTSTYALPCMLLWNLPDDGRNGRKV